MNIERFLGHVAAALCSFGLATAAQAQINEHTFRFTTTNPAGHPIVAGAEKWAALVQQKSGGKITIKIFPGGVLGADDQVLSATRRGKIDFTAMNSGYLQARIRAFALLDFPFLFNDEKEADAILDGPIGKQLADKTPAKGLINLAFWELGFRNLTNNKRPIIKMEDISGLKIRVIPSSIYSDTFNALGAEAVPMPFPEVYRAMKRRTIDGHENALSVIEANKIYEVQKYLTITNHVYNPQSLLASKKTWDKLTADEQSLLASTAIEAGKFEREISRSGEAQTLANLQKLMQVNVLSHDELAKLRTSLQPVIEKYTVMVGPELVGQVQSQLEKMRKK